ncbi:hypothetical protein FPV67DRAFT_351407 [Lyophyllum atratum]|nr:hypothetical protein FPV67DRAFT_351407 [Lyophyllum atratum]
MSTQIHRHNVYPAHLIATFGQATKSKFLMCFTNLKLVPISHAIVFLLGRLFRGSARRYRFRHLCGGCFHIGCQLLIHAVCLKSPEGFSKASSSFDRHYLYVGRQMLVALGQVPSLHQLFNWSIQIPHYIQGVIRQRPLKISTCEYPQSIAYNANATDIWQWNSEEWTSLDERCTYVN